MTLEPRYEKKFVLENIPMSQIKAYVLRHPAGFRQAYPERTINNVYLDSPGLESFYSHVNGAAQRTKIRIRWYGNSFMSKIPSPLVEKKLKVGLIHYKLSLPASTISLNHNFRKSITDAILNLVPDNALKNELASLNPVLFNRYRRMYFIDASGRVRLTLDYQLEFLNLLNCHLFDSQFTKFLKPLTIIELKFKPQSLDYASDLASKFSFRLSKFSKYVVGVQLSVFQQSLV